MSLNELTIAQSSEGLREKQFSSVELTKAVFDQIKKTDPDINAFLTLNEDEAIDSAKEIDRRRSAGEELNELSGIPVAIKDNILVKGLKCTAASKILENYIAPYNATVVERLKSAGAIIIGKTNLDEFAMGSSTENSAYQVTKNPWDLERVPGGSSGGSAAAVAANETIYALGSDTGGSIRQPASFCGVVGLKPTYGAVSRFGLMAMASSLDQIGPITKTVEDCKIVFDAIKGKDSLDSTSVESKIGDLKLLARRSAGEGGKIENLRIGLPKEYFAEGMDPEVETLIKGAIKKFQELGVEIKEISLPHSEYALACYYLIMPSEVSANLARYDGIKYGYSALNDQAKLGLDHAQRGDEQFVIRDLLEGYLKTRQHGFGDEARRRIMLGTYALSAGYYDAYYLKAQKARALVKKDFEEAFKKVDLIAAPVSPTPAFKIGEKIDDPVKMYLSDIFTVPVNLAGLPAMSLPCGKAELSPSHAQRGENIKNLPVGLQIIGPQFGEEVIFQTALSYVQSL